MIEKKHSGYGIASFIGSLVFGLAVFALILFAGFVEMRTPGGLEEENALAIVIGLLVLGCLIGAIVFLGLGIAGLFQSDRRKVFAIFGTLISAGIVVLVGIILISG